MVKNILQHCAWLFTLLPLVVVASSWSPTLLVNTEAFQTIDEGDGTADVVLRFGDSLNKTITFNRSSDQFDFSDDIFVTGNITTTGTLSGSSLVVSGSPNCDTLDTDATGLVICGTDDGGGGGISRAEAEAIFVNQGGDTMTGALTISNNAALTAAGNITLNSDNGAADAILTFGNDALAETLLFSDTSNAFEFSDDVNVNGNLTTTGTLSGSSLVVSSIPGCIQMGTNATGQAMCEEFIQTTTADTTDTVIGGTNTIAGISIPVSASTNYIVECNFTTSAAINTTGVQITVNGPAAPINVSINRRSCSSTTTLISAYINGFGTEDARTASNGLTRCIEDHIIHLRNGLTGGNITFSLDTEVAASVVTSHAGSYCTWRSY